MDSLTHIVLGATIGEIYAGEKIGKRILLYGALAQSFPDIDFVSSFWLSTPDYLLAHRGISHSILTACLASVIFAYAALLWHRPPKLTFWSWLLFFLIQIFTHLSIDSLNSYGIGWFEPFSHERISFNTLFVADPFITVPLIITSVALLIVNEKSKRRKYWAGIGLICSLLYISYAIAHKVEITKSVQANLSIQNIEHKRYFTTPTPLNTWLWYVVIENDDGYYIGYQSVNDRNKIIDFEFFNRNAQWITPLADDHDVQKLLQFSQGYYTVEKIKGVSIFNDLRFGQIMGWSTPKAPFVFHYYLQQPEDLLVVQRGRFAGWNKKSFMKLIERIKGN